MKEAGLPSMELKSKPDTLVVVDRYPSKDNLYAYAFVHARVKAYIKQGVSVAVFCLNGSTDKPYVYEFEGVQVLCGNAASLRLFFETYSPKSISVHFLTKAIWAAIESLAIETPTYVWLHGSDSQDWSRRYFVFETSEQRLKGVWRYREYYEFWRGLFNSPSHRLHFVFVSHYLATEIFDDMDVSLPSDRYSVIHNYIDTDLFSYSKKAVDQRLRILSIRPYASRVYANDLTAAAIRELATRPFFTELEFTIIGKGRLFEEVTDPLKDYENVTVREEFLTQEAIAAEHKKHGVFLVPSRSDTQGVSRDEAMSSGLVPVTNYVAAVPEFLGPEEGFLLPAEDSKGLADAIETLYRQPELFSSMSAAAAKRVRAQSGFSSTIQREVELIHGKHQPVKGESIFKAYSTAREKALRDALFDLVDETSETKNLKTEYSKQWKKSLKLAHRVRELESSKSYKVGRVVTFPLRRAYAHRVVRTPVDALKFVIHPGRKTIMHDKSVRYGDLFETPKSKKFYTKKQLTNMTIAAITDEFTHNSLKSDVNIVQLTPENWQQQLASARPDMLFVESAWRGFENKWTNMVSKVPSELRGIIDYCNKHDIPTAFWNKEDPVHTIHFIKTASLFDYVFTTDLDSIPLYKDILGHSRIYLLPFAAQPAFNNPIEEYSRKDKFNFAGSYYRAFKDRCRDFEQVTDGILGFRSLDIYDRNHGKNLSIKYQFPDKYQQYIKGSLPYSEIDKAYKGYKYAITMNTIKYSSTMFARRAFELLASNTITVGNYSKGVINLLGDLTISSDDKNEIRHRLEMIAKSPLDEDKFKLLGLRRVMEQHTYKERLGRIFDKVFVDFRNTPDKDVAVLALVSSQEELEALVANYQRQTHAAKKLFIIKDRYDMKIPEGIEKDCSVLDPKNKRQFMDTLGMFDYIAVLDPGAFYGRFYLTDMVLATQYAEEGMVIGKAAYFKKSGSKKLDIKNKKKQYSKEVPIRITAALVPSSSISHQTPKSLVDDIKSRKTYNHSTLSIDGFNFCEQGNALSEAEIQDIEGVLDINQGLAIDDLYRMADSVSENIITTAKTKLRKKLRIRKTHPAQEEV